MSESEESAPDQFIRIFKDQIRPVLALRLPDEVFQPGRETELARRLSEIIDERIVADKIPIGRQLRIKLIESLMADIERAQRERFDLG